MSKIIVNDETYESPNLREFNIRVQRCIAVSGGNTPENFTEEDGNW